MRSPWNAADAISKQARHRVSPRIGHEAFQAFHNAFRGLAFDPLTELSTRSRNGCEVVVGLQKSREVRLIRAGRCVERTRECREWCVGFETNRRAPPGWRAQSSAGLKTWPAVRARARMRDGSLRARREPHAAFMSFEVRPARCCAVFHEF